VPVRTCNTQEETKGSI